MKTTDILSYSRKPPNPAFQAILDALSSSQQETWNLMFLLLPVERRYVFTAGPNAESSSFDQVVQYRPQYDHWS